MATLEIDDTAIKPLVDKIAEAVIKALDIPAIAKAAALEAAKLGKSNVKPMYSSGEVAKLLGITVVALQARRLNGHIKGVREVGGRSFMFSRQEVERVLGKSLE